MADLQKIGGLQVVLKELLENGLLHGDCMTVAGKTLKETLADTPSIAELKDTQDVLFPIAKPFAMAGNLESLDVNLRNINRKSNG